MPYNWPKINHRIWALIGSILLSSILGTIIYSHWVYFGCELARDSDAGRLSLFREMLNPNCPATDLLPKTPLQRVALTLLPYNAQVAKFSYGLACKKNAHATCESLFALSFLSAISEWAFYLFMIIKIVHKFILKPLFDKMLTLAIVLSVGLLIGKLSECYAPAILSEETAPHVVYWAQTGNRVICEAVAFVCSFGITVFHSIRKIVLMDEFPGASLLRSLNAAVPLVKARVAEWRSEL